MNCFPRAHDKSLVSCTAVPLRSAGSWRMDRERAGTEQRRLRSVLSCVGRPATVGCTIRIPGPNNMCGKSCANAGPKTNCGETTPGIPPGDFQMLKKGFLDQSTALQVHLRHHKYRYGEKRGRFHGIRKRDERSRQALWRKRIGDREVDTIVSSNRKGCLLSICDRKSRYCGLVLWRSCSAKEDMHGFRFLT